MGRPPRPMELKILEGKTGSHWHQKDPATIPKTTTGIGSMPNWLNAEGRNEWKRIVPELEGIGLLTRVDTAALATYCQAFGRMVQAERSINRHGMVQEVINVRGFPELKERPEMKIIQQCQRVIKSFLVEFGLSPSSRGRLQLPSEAPPRSDLEDLLD